MTWKPGQSGNPSGRPKRLEGYREALYEATPDAIRTLVAACSDADASWKDRIAAAVEILDRVGLTAPAGEDGKADDGAIVRALAMLGLSETQRAALVAAARGDADAGQA